MSPSLGFPGSYAPGDVTFLLKRIVVKELGVHEKEKYIQSGGGHYSEVLTPESPATLSSSAIWPPSVGL